MSDEYFKGWSNNNYEEADPPKVSISFWDTLKAKAVVHNLHLCEWEATSEFDSWVCLSNQCSGGESSNSIKEISGLSIQVKITRGQLKTLSKSKCSNFIIKKNLGKS